MENRPPVGTESKAEQFAKAALRDGFRSAQVYVRDGSVRHMSLFEADGTQHFYSMIEGELCRYKEVKDGRPD